MPRQRASSSLQLSIFTTSLGEFAKDAIVLCVALEHTPTVRDLPFLQSVCRDLQAHAEKHAGESAFETASDIECLNDAIARINQLIDHFDDWRLQTRGDRDESCPVTRTEINALFETRSALRTLVIRLHQ